MSDKYNQSDLRWLISERTNVPAGPEASEPFSGDQNQLTTQNYSPAMAPAYEPLLGLTEGFGSGMIHFEDSKASLTAAAPFLRPNHEVIMESEWSAREHDDHGDGGGNNANSRWPRQETLTLLQIRSRLHSKFKQSNQKGPLWDQVSRMMDEEYGYKRSGKKCKEKFDNLYKYYKKTKEGKTGRHDGKHYRFFRQLEAIYGECSDQFSQVAGNHTSGNGILPPADHQKNAEPTNDLSFSMSSDFDTSSSGNYHGDDLSAIAFMMNRKKKEEEKATEKEGREGRGGARVKRWEEEVSEMVDSKLRKMMEVQESWMENMVTRVESREKERAKRDEEWREREVARCERERREFCETERAWLQAREGVLMEIIKKFAGKEKE